MNAISLTSLPARAAAATTEPAPCLVLNPRSHSLARGRLAARARALAAAQGVEILEAHDPAALAAGLERLLAGGTRPLFVLAGDGTVQAIVDWLARRPAGAALPALLVLGGGRTNLTAADLGGDRDVLGRLESALARAGSGAAFAVQHRQALVIEQPPAPPRHGFFVAAAQVDRLIRRCHRFREQGDSRLRQGRLGTIGCLLMAAIPAARAREPYACAELDVRMAGGERLRGPMRLLVATTLAHRTGADPYADRGAGGLRMTAVSLGARGFWRRLPRLLRGRFSPAMAPEQGYLSGRCDSFAVTGLDGYTLDGQSFDADPARPVAVRCGPRLAFLVP